MKKMKQLSALFCIALSLSALPMGSAYASSAVIAGVEVFNDECPICRDDFEEEESIALSCKHGYHKACLEEQCKTLLMGNPTTPLTCANCRTALSEEIHNTLLLGITEDELFGYIINGGIDEISQDSFNPIKNVILSFLNQDDTAQDLQEIFSLTEEEATTTIAELTALIEPLTINKLKGQEYIEELRGAEFFSATEKTIKQFLATHAVQISQTVDRAIRQLGQQDPVGLARIAPYINAFKQLLGKLNGNIYIDQDSALFARLQALDPMMVILGTMATIHTGAPKEDIRSWINYAAGKEQDTWLPSKLFLMREVWGLMPSFTQTYFRKNPGKKMATLWLVSSVKFALFCAISTLLIDAIIRVRLEKVDKKRIEKDPEARPLTPYFSWPLRTYAAIWMVLALRAWRAHNVRPL